MIGIIESSSAQLFKPVPYNIAIKFRFTAETQRTPREFLVIQSRETRDWITNGYLSGTDFMLRSKVIAL